MESFIKYQEKLLKQQKPMLDEEDKLFVYTMGLAGDAGEVCNQLKRHVQYDNLNVNHLANRLGNVVKYTSLIASLYEIGLDFQPKTFQENIVEQNLKKVDDKSLLIPCYALRLTSRAADTALFVEQWIEGWKCTLDDLTFRERLKNKLLHVLYAVAFTAYLFEISFLDILDRSLDTRSLSEKWLSHKHRIM